MILLYIKLQKKQKTTLFVVFLKYVVNLYYSIKYDLNQVNHYIREVIVVVPDKYICFPINYLIG